MTKTRRLNEVLVRIYEKQKFTVDELANEFQVSYRTMLRYLQELSGMGVPLYAEVGKHGGYSILKSSRSSHKQQESSFKRVIKPMTHLVGLEFMAPFTAVYMAKVRVPLMWQQLNNRAHEVHNAIGRQTRIGVSLNRSHIYHYIAGIEVSHPRLVPQDMVSMTISTREYAVYNHAGETSRAEIDETYFYLLDKLRKQGLDHDPNAYTLEIYTGDDLNELAIYLPLKA